MKRPESTLIIDTFNDLGEKGRELVFCVMWFPLGKEVEWVVTGSARLLRDHVVLGFSLMLISEGILIS